MELRHEGLQYVLGSRRDAHEVAVKLARLYHRDRWRYSLRKRLLDVDAVPLEHPIFLLGLPGSGGTLVGRCLRRHRDVVSASGNSDFWTGTDELGLIRNRMKKLPLPYRANRYRGDIEHPLFGSTQFFACDSLLPHYRATASDAGAAERARYRRILREHIAVYAHNARRARFIDKTHANTVKIPLLSATLSAADPRFVLVVRNPYTACPWMVRRKPPDLRVPLSNAEQLRLVAEHWANAYRIALEDAADGARVAVLRFEDFLADPQDTMRALCAFLELDYDESLLPRAGDRLPFATLRDDRKWYPLYPDTREAPSREDALIVGERCAALAERFGYFVDGMTPAEEPLELLAGPAPLRFQELLTSLSGRSHATPG
jgi:hypothetical protein